MNNKNYLLKISAIVGLVFGLSFGVMAAPDIYLTKAGSVKLNFVSAEGYVLSAGDQVLWQRFDAADVSGNSIPGTEQVKTYNNDLGDVALVLTGDEISDLGSHYYKAAVITADPAKCAGDVSDGREIYRLPDLNVGLVASIAEYCAENSADVGGAVESVFTAATTTQDDEVLPADILLTYAWAAEKDAVDVADVSGIGTASTSPTADLTSTFTLNTAETGKYDFTASVEYGLESSSGIAIKGASLIASNEATVNVTPKPGKPTIMIE